MIKGLFWLLSFSCIWNDAGRTLDSQKCDAGRALFKEKSIVIINFPEELRVGETRLASAEDLDSLQSEVEVPRAESIYLHLYYWQYILTTGMWVRGLPEKREKTFPVQNLEVFTSNRHWGY